MKLKQKVTLLILMDLSLFIILLYLLYLEMWFESLIPFLLSLGIGFWNYPVQISMGGGYSFELKNIIEAHSNTFRLAQEIFF